MTPNFDEENKIWKQGYKKVAGLDEAGRGPLAGPVVACAVTMDFGRSDIRKYIWISDLKNIRDSKQLSEKQREELYEILTNHKEIKWGVGVISEKIIDKINILEATKLAMQKAVTNLRRGYLGGPTSRQICREDGPPNIDFLILDGNFKIESDVPQKSIIKGDEKVFSCACASIIAKVTRDRLMLEYDKKYPQYGFEKHKGYPTKFHREMIKKYGPSEIHRKSFTLV